MPGDPRPLEPLQTSGGVVAVVPVRLGSRRFPRKALADLDGLPVVEHVRRRALAAGSVDRVVVAAADDEVVQVIRAHGGEVLHTGAARSGSQRVALAIDGMEPAPRLVVNVQGDQPLLDPAHVDAVVALLDGGARVATLAAPMLRDADPGDPNVVKVVASAAGHALYFSRRAIPYEGPWLRHLGIYGFTPDALRWCTTAPEGHLAASEDLEQLRWLEAGARIHLGVVDEAAGSVDTEEQLTILRRRLASGEISSPPQST